CPSGAVSQSCGADLGPRSFPTRRSSDLAGAGAGGAALAAASRCWASASATSALRSAAFALRSAENSRFLPPSLGFHGSVLKISRSEEHTSELQSRFALVCRLLLETKNKS